MEIWPAGRPQAGRVSTVCVPVLPWLPLLTVHMPSRSGAGVSHRRDDFMHVVLHRFPQVACRSWPTYAGSSTGYGVEVRLSASIRSVVEDGSGHSVGAEAGLGQ